jgi:germination protein M
MKPMKFATYLSVIAMCMTTMGCSLFASEASKEIDPPQDFTPQVITETIHPTSEISEVDQKSETRLQTIYAKDSKGFLAPISVRIPQTPSPARTTLEYMVEGGLGSQVLPAGFQAVLPKDTQIKGVNLIPSRKQVVVDFSQSFTNYAAEDERKILEALTWTLTGFPNIQSVEIWVEGIKINEMPVAQTPLDTSWSRAMGINLENAEQAIHNQTTPVTLYFLNQNEHHYTYYVPITRMIKRTTEIEKAVIAQLILGPDDSKGLHTAILPSTEVNSVHTTDELITVDFNEFWLGPDQTVSADALHMVLLSLTENTNKNFVQFTVNGKPDVKTNEENYSNPVERPKYVNKSKL